jgi:hypothetical protein
LNFLEKSEKNTENQKPWFKSVVQVLDMQISVQKLNTRLRKTSTAFQHKFS